MNSISGDWTNRFSRKKLSEDSNDLINNIVSSLHSKNIKLLSQYSFSENEINLLFRWSLYVATNTFIERLIRVIDKKNKIEEKINVKLADYMYHTNLAFSSYEYYNNRKLNLRLISDISDIISNKKEYSLNKPRLPLSKHEIKYPKKYTLIDFLIFLKKKLKKATNLFFINHNIDFLFDDSKWLNLIFSEKNKIKELDYKMYDLDNISRSEFRECFYNEFLNFLNTSSIFSNTLEEKIKMN